MRSLGDHGRTMICGWRLAHIAFSFSPFVFSRVSFSEEEWSTFESYSSCFKAHRIGTHRWSLRMGLHWARRTQSWLDATWKSDRIKYIATKKTCRRSSDEGGACFICRKQINEDTATCFEAYSVPILWRRSLDESHLTTQASTAEYGFHSCWQRNGYSFRQYITMDLSLIHIWRCPTKA